ncbi:MAG: TlpA disulfide reductase family protein [Bacteroidota bacterium]
MKNNLVIFCYLLFTIVACQPKEAPNELLVSMEKVVGSGPFYPGKGALSPIAPESELSPLTEKITGLPEGLDSLLEIGQWEADFIQWIYQGYYNQLIDSTLAYRWLDELKPEDTAKYTKEMVDGQIAIAFGKNASGQKVVIVDTNNNEDFSDEKTLVFTQEDSLAYTAELNPDKDRLAVFQITYERYDGQRVVEEEKWLQVNPYFYNRYWVGTLEYQRGVVSLNNRDYYLSLSNSFYRPVYRPDNIVVAVEDSFPEEYNYKIPKDSMFAYQEMMSLGDELYQIVDVSLTGDELRLKKHPKGEVWRGTQVGATAYAIDTLTITGDSYQVPNGKLLLVDFWGTWCSPCRRELPFLKDAYAFFGGEQFEVVGIASDKLDKLQEFVSEQALPWPQIHQEKPNQQIIEQYRVIGYPTTYLIGGQGEILAKNNSLRGHQLIQTVQSQLNLPDTALAEKVREGSVLIRLAGEEHQNWIIEGDFSNDKEVPLYLIDKFWQRGFDLEPGEYTYKLKSNSQVPQTSEGSFSVQEETKEVLLSAVASLQPND